MRVGHDLAGLIGMKAIHHGAVQPGRVAHLLRDRIAKRQQRVAGAQSRHGFFDPRVVIPIQYRPHVVASGWLHLDDQHPGRQVHAQVERFAFKRHSRQTGRQCVGGIVFEFFAIDQLLDTLCRRCADHLGQRLAEQGFHAAASPARTVLADLRDDQINWMHCQQHPMVLDASGCVHRFIIAMGDGHAMAFDAIRKRQCSG